MSDDVAPRSRRYAWYVLGLLTTINFVNYVDRMVVVSMYDDLRATFQVTNRELGLISTVFFIVHAVTTFPFGWLADHYNRKVILGLAVIGWSMATLASAYAWVFLALLVFRSMIGVGEAAYGPISNALLAETFRPEEKARTIGIFNAGMFAGACVGVATGAILGFPRAFEIVAIPGFILGVLAWTLKVPPRRIAGAVVTPPFTKIMKDFWRVTHTRTMRWMVLSGILISFGVGGSIAWLTDFVVHVKGIPKEKASLTLGVIVLTAGVAGAITGGWVADRLQRHGPWGRTLAIAVGFLLSTPFSLGFLYADQWWLFYVCAWLQMFFLPWYNGPMAAVVDDVVDDKDANAAQAATAFWYHLIGTGTGAFVVGAVAPEVITREAMLIPIGAAFLSAICALIACKYVGGDMEARRLRASGAATPHSVASGHLL